MSRKHEKVCVFLKYIEHFIILAFTITGCMSVSAFAFLLNIAIGIRSSSIGIKICSIVKRIKKNQPIIKKNEKKHDKIVLLVIYKLDSIKFLIFKALIALKINHDKFALTNNVLKEYGVMTKEIKNLKT